MKFLLEMDEWLCEGIMPYKWKNFKIPNFKYLKFKQSLGVYFFSKDEASLRSLDRVKYSEMEKLGKDRYTALFHKQSAGRYEFSFLYNNDEKMTATNKNEVFKVIATLKAIVQDFIRKNKNVVDTIQFGGADETRFQFYLRAVKNAAADSKDIAKYDIGYDDTGKKIMLYIK